MNETGFYVVNERGEYQLVYASVPVWDFTGEPTDNVRIEYEPYSSECAPIFNRHSPDAPVGHRILWHRPRYRLGWQWEVSS